LTKPRLHFLFLFSVLALELVGDLKLLLVVSAAISSWGGDSCI